MQRSRRCHVCLVQSLEQKSQRTMNNFQALIERNVKHLRFGTCYVATGMLFQRNKAFIT